MEDRNILLPSIQLIIHSIIQYSLTRGRQVVPDRDMFPETSLPSGYMTSKMTSMGRHYNVIIASRTCWTGAPL